MLRASELRLLEQLPRAPAEWQPAVISSHAVGGTLALSCSDIVACGGAMHAVRDVHSLTLHVATADRLNDVSLFRAALPCMETALTSLPALRTFRVENASQVGPCTRLLMPVLARLPQLARFDLRHGAIDAATLAPPLASLTALTALHLRYSKLGKHDAAAIATALSRLSRLASLTLAALGRDLDAHDVAALSLGCLTALTALDLSDNAIRASGAVALAPAPVSYTHLEPTRLRRSRMPSSA